LANAAGGVAAIEALPSRQVAAPAQFAMPQVVGLTEQQAREALLRLGVPAALIVSDYQDRAKLGELFDRVPAFSVVSSLPAAGEAIGRDTVIVLGVRGPEPPPSQP
jgi:peptidoglycan glycosyltransferase